jgi:hypothetical protein
MMDPVKRARSPFLWRFARALALASVTASSTGCIAALALQDSGPSGDELRQLQEESAPYQKRGSGSISGLVTLETPRGQLTAPPGTQVYLTPATTYALQRLQKYAIEKNELPEKRESQLMWFASTDAEGRFRFTELPPGDYILASRVLWSPSSTAGDSRAEVAYARVHLAAGESITVMVTRSVTQ